MANSSILVLAIAPISGHGQEAARLHMISLNGTSSIGGVTDLVTVTGCPSWACDSEGDYCPHGTSGSGQGGYTCCGGTWKWSNGFPSCGGMPDATICHGYSCTVSGQRCPPDRPGSWGDGFHCVQGTWTPGYGPQEEIIHSCGGWTCNADGVYCPEGSPGVRGHGGYTCCGGIWTWSNGSSSCSGTPDATSCEGWNCTVEGQRCAPGRPGSSDDGFHCSQGRWTSGYGHEDGNGAGTETVSLSSIASIGGMRILDVIGGAVGLLIVASVVPVAAVWRMDNQRPLSEALLQEQAEA